MAMNIGAYQAGPGMDIGAYQTAAASGGGGPGSTWRYKMQPWIPGTRDLNHPGFHKSRTR